MDAGLVSWQCLQALLLYVPSLAVMWEPANDSHVAFVPRLIAGSRISCVLQAKPRQQQMQERKRLRLSWMQSGGRLKPGPPPSGGWSHRCGR
jgi:hypothetical protein